MADREIICETALNNVLKNEFPQRHYSIGVFSDERVCLEKTGANEYEVYYGSRGMKDQQTVYSNIVSACIAMIHKLCNSMEDERRITDNFLDQIMVEKIA